MDYQVSVWGAWKTVSVYNYNQTGRGILMFESVLLFNISKQIITQQKLCWGQAVVSNWTNEFKGGRWNSKTEFRRVAQLVSFFYLFSFEFILVAWCIILFSRPKFSDSKGLKAWAWMYSQNNNSSICGTSQTYSGSKTRDCKQMEEHWISEQECVDGL